AARHAGTDTLLAGIAQGNLYPEIVRATALEYLAAGDNQVATFSIRKALKDPEPIVRYSAVLHFSAATQADLISALSPLIRDSVRSVRLEAAGKLLSADRSLLDDSVRPLLDSAIDERERVLKYSADFPAGRFNLGHFYELRHDSVRAEANYKEAIVLDSLFYPAKVNLAYLYYSEGRLSEAERLFLDLTRNHSEYEDGYFDLGLLYVEQGRISEAITQLESASRLHPGSKVSYNLALLYLRAGEPGKSERVLLDAILQDQRDFRLLYALCHLYIEAAGTLKNR